MQRLIFPDSILRYTLGGVYAFEKQH